MKGSSNEAWLTAVTVDEDVQKALILCTSLRKVYTTRKIAVLVSPSVKKSLRNLLYQVFDLVCNLDLNENDKYLPEQDFAALYGLIALASWKKVVYLSPFSLVMQNCDEIFNTELSHDFALPKTNIVNTKLDQDTVDTKLDQGTVDTKLDRDTVDTNLDQDTVDTKLDQDTVDTKLDKDTVDTKLEQDSVDTILDQDTADTKLDQDTVDTKLDKDTVDTKLDQDTADTKLDQDTVDTKLDQDTVDTKLDQDTVDTKLDRDTVDTKLDQDTADTKLDQDTADTKLDKDTVDTKLDFATILCYFKNFTLPKNNVNLDIFLFRPSFQNFNYLMSGLYENGQAYNGLLSYMTSRLENHFLYLEDKYCVPVAPKNKLIGFENDICIVHFTTETYPTEVPGMLNKMKAEHGLLGEPIGKYWLNLLMEVKPCPIQTTDAPLPNKQDHLKSDN